LVHYPFNLVDNLNNNTWFAMTMYVSPLEPVTSETYTLETFQYPILSRIAKTTAMNLS